MNFYVYDSELDFIEGYKNDRAKAEARAMEFSQNTDEVRYGVLIRIPVMKFPELRLLAVYFQGIEEYNTDRYDEDIREIMELEAQAAPA